MRKWTLIIFSFLLCSCSEPVYETIDGILQVPENRENPNSRTLNLVYKVLKAKEPDSLKAPIVFLQGGPGAPTLIMEEFWANHPLRNDRDIILMDQRGTGASEANCTKLGDAMFAILRQDLDPEEEINTLKAIISECQETTKQKGVDFAGYNSRENAADFEDLRKNLGYNKWNLFGGSYGSRLGLTIIRDFPKSIRSAVLIAIAAPESDLILNGIKNFETSLFTVLVRCEKNEDCNNRYPNLKKRLFQTLKKIQTEPLSFDFEGKPFVLNTQDALLLLFFSLYDRYSISNIPLLIEALESGETLAIGNALTRVEFIYNFVNWPINLSVMAYEELPFTSLTDLDKVAEQSEIGYGFASNSSRMKLLDSWHSSKAKAIENQPVISEIPTLMASGGLDPVTPESYARQSLKNLKNSYGIVFPDESHELINPCFFQIAEDFINNPSQKPNTACSSKRNPIEWNLSNPIQ